MRSNTWRTNCWSCIRLVEETAESPCWCCLPGTLANLVRSVEEEEEGEVDRPQAVSYGWLACQATLKSLAASRTARTARATNT